MEWQKDEYMLTDDRKRVDIVRTHQLLNETYWGVRRPIGIVEKMVDASLCFTLMLDNRQIGFARCVTDSITFSWIADFVIASDYRARGLGKWMLACILEHPHFNDTQKVLQTRDAHGYYEQYGFRRNQALMSTEIEGL